MTAWLAIIFAVLCSFGLSTSTVWEKNTPQLMEAVLNQRAELLTLLTAVFGVLAIMIRQRSLPRESFVIVISGGLTGYAAVVNSFNVTGVAIALAILLATLPIWIFCTAALRLPRGWEWAWWSIIGAIILLALVIMTSNTSLGILIYILLLGDEAYGIMILFIGIGALILFIAFAAIVVKAVGMAQKNHTAQFFRRRSSSGRSRRGR